jgi:hypothetical protein
MAAGQVFPADGTSGPDIMSVQQVEHSTLSSRAYTAVPSERSSKDTKLKAPTQRPPRQAVSSHKRNYCVKEAHALRLADSKQPYGTKEGVDIGTSRLPSAGGRLFGLRASKDDPLLFKQAHEFVSVYTTMADVKTANEAQVSDSEYIWSNNKNHQLDWDPEA